jgi:hypothetical protein
MNKPAVFFAISMLCAAPVCAQYSSSSNRSNRSVLNAAAPPAGAGGGLGAPTIAGSTTTFGTAFGAARSSGGPANKAYGNTGLGPAPGVSSLTGIGLSPGQFFYYNNPGVGFYSVNPFASQFPAAVAPIPLGSGFYSFAALGSRCGYWRSPSGYYYPWCPPVYLPGNVYTSTQDIYILNEGQLTSVKPPIAQVLSDLRNFIEDARSKNQLDQSNYEQFAAQLNDLTSRSAQLAQKNNGMLDSSDDALIRSQLDGLISEITRALQM